MSFRVKKKNHFEFDRLLEKRDKGEFGIWLLKETCKIKVFQKGKYFEVKINTIWIW